MSKYIKKFGKSNYIKNIRHCSISRNKNKSLFKFGLFGIVSYGAFTYWLSPMLSNKYPNFFFNIRAKNIQYIEEENQTENMCIQAAISISNFDFLMKNLKVMTMGVSSTILLCADRGKYTGIENFETLIYDPLVKCPYIMYYTYFSALRDNEYLKYDKPQNQIMCNAAYDANVNNLSYIKPEFRTKTMYDNIFNKIENKIMLYNMQGPHLTTKDVKFHPGLYFKNEFKILVDSYIECHDNDIKIYVSLYDKDKDIFYISLSDEDKNIGINITSDDLYNAINNKDIILSKFGSNLNYINPNNSYIMKKTLKNNNHFDYYQSKI